MDTNPTAIFESVNASVKKTKELNRTRAHRIRNFCGPGFSASGPRTEHAASDGSFKVGARGGKRVPVMFDAMFSLLPLIIVDPVPVAKPKYNAELAPFAYLLGEAVDLVAKLNNFSDVMEVCGMNMLFGMGVIHTTIKGVTAGPLENPEGRENPKVRPITESIDQSDFIYDVTATTGYHQCAFLGHIQRLPRVTAMAMYPDKKEIIEYIPAIDNIGSDSDDGSSYLYGTEEAKHTNPYDEIALAHLWLRKENRLIVIPYDDNEAYSHCMEIRKEKDKDFPLPLLKDSPYKGPASGPYTVAAPFRCPNTVIPMSFADIMSAMEEVQNDLMDKMIARGMREKEVTLVDGEEKDAKDLSTAVDGALKYGDGLNMAQTHKFGGISQSMLAMYGLIDTTTKNIGFNQDLLGGTGLPSETYRSSQLLANASETKVKFILKESIRAAIDVFGKLAYWVMKLNDLEFDIPVSFGDGLDTVIKWDKSIKEGNPEDFILDVKARLSRTYTSEEEYQKKLRFLSEVFMPLAGVAAQAGSVPNAKEIIDSMSRDIGLEKETVSWLENQAPIEPKGLATNVGSTQRQVNVSGSGGQSAPGSETEEF